MTRINTNVSSLTAQKTLARSNAALQQALTRLSTGLRINSGKDDPAGLIASEVLKSDITSTNKAISNSQRAAQMIATADSALGQMSSLLNDIRGLVSEAANTGAMSAEQIEANQLQIDSSLEAMDRISQVTQFQGKRLLDGSLDFLTVGTDDTKLRNVKIDQATFGSSSQIGVNVEVVEQATQASLNFAYTAVSEAVVLQVGGKDGFETFQFAAGSSVNEMAAAINLVSDSLGVRADVAAGASKGTLTVSSLGANNDMVLTAKNAGFDAGNVNVKYTLGNSEATTVTYAAGSNSGDPGTIEVALRTVAGVSATGTTDDADLMTHATAISDQGIAGSEVVFTAVQAGAAGNNLKVVTETTAGTSEAIFNEATGVLTLRLNGANADDVVALVNGNATVSQHIKAALGGTSGTGVVTAGKTYNLSGAKGDVNNDMVITANQTGVAFNSNNVHVVSGNATALGIQSINRKASLTIEGAGANESISFTSKVAGEAGNDIQIAFQAGGAAAVAVSGTKITVTMAAGTTAASVKTLIENSAAASALVDVSVGTADYVMGATVRNTGQHLNNGFHASETFDTGAGPTFKVRAKESGSAGEQITVEFTTTEDPSSVTVEGNKITINVDSDDTVTASAIRALVVGSAAASRLIDMEIVGNAAAEIQGMTAIAETALTTGEDFGHSLQGEIVEYSDVAKAARASVTWGTNSDMIITATQAGDAYNDVSIRVATEAGVGATTPRVSYSDKTLTITIDDTTDTDLDDIIAAVNAYKVDGVQIFSAEKDSSAGSTGEGVVLHNITAGEVGNTKNTGAAAGTLFIYVEEGVTSANSIIEQMAKAKATGLGTNAADNMTKRAAELFTISRAGGNDGTGRVFAKSFDGLLTGGINGGGVAATSEEVINAINNSADLQNLLSASLATGNDGTGIVAAFQEAGYYGSLASNNQLQFLGGANSPAIRLVAGAAGSSLSIQDTRTQSSLVKDATNANAALKFSAKNVGAEYDGVRIVFVDDDNVTKGNEVVTYDKDSKTLRFAIASGNEAGANTTANDIINALKNDDIASQFFVASNFGTSNGAGEVDADLKQADATVTFTNNDVLRIRSDKYGSMGNAYSVVIQDGVSSSAIFNEETGVLTVTADVANTNVAKLANLINTAMGGEFTAEVVTMNAGTAVNAKTADFSGGIGTDSNNNGVPDPVATDKVTSGGRGDTLTINLAVDSQGVITTTANDLIAFFNDAANATLVNNYGVSVSSVGSSTGTGRLAATTTDIDMVSKGTTTTPDFATGTSTAVNGLNARVKVTADQIGTGLGNVRVVYVNDDLITVGNETASYADGVLTVRIDEGNTRASHVINAINNDVGTLFTAANGDTGDGSGFVTTSDSLTLSSGLQTTGTVQGVALVGNDDAASTGLTIRAIEYGSDAFVSVKALSGSFLTKDAQGNAATRSAGTDVKARVNGIEAIGRGLTATINTSALDMTFTLLSTMQAGDATSFAITGGGAQFQLGPDVVSNQQARIGITSVSTAKLGGNSGWLYELRSGGTKSLTADVGGAAKVVEEVISQITNLRGRLGAFQKTTVESNIATLSDTVETLTSAQSDIADADFAAESAAMTRAQILVQAGTTVLATANQNPQNVLALLR